MINTNSKKAIIDDCVNDKFALYTFLVFIAQSRIKYEA